MQARSRADRDLHQISIVADGHFVIQKCRKMHKCVCSSALGPQVSEGIAHPYSAPPPAAACAPSGKSTRAVAPIGAAQRISAARGNNGKRRLQRSQCWRCRGDKKSLREPHYLQTSRHRRFVPPPPVTAPRMSIISLFIVAHNSLFGWTLTALLGH